MAQIVSWDHVDRREWTYSRENRNIKCIVYRIDKLPDFSDARFEYLSRDTEGRGAAVISRQMLMLRQLHGLGSDWGLSLRYVKHGHRITLYLVFRWSGVSGGISDAARGIINNALLTNEYSFTAVDHPGSEFGLRDLSWVNSFAEIQRYESVYNGDTYPDGTSMKYYVPFLWTPAENNMEHLCESLLSQSGNAVAEVTLVPAKYLDDEKKWMNGNMTVLRDAMNGETIRNDSGKILWQGKALPGLRTPLENCEKMHKQFETGRVFMSAVRLYSENDAEALASAYLTNSVRNEGSVSVNTKEDAEFQTALKAYGSVDITPEVQSELWMKKSGKGMRPQRFPKLICLDEAAAFFRLPIPAKPGFPGFGFDTGLHVGEASEKKKSGRDIQLGRYLDGTEGTAGTAAAFQPQELAKHGLIVGVPGSGKTTAVFNLLYQLWDAPEAERIPFIVLEPAKTEYRALKKLGLFSDDMRVFTLGDESVSPFRFNPLEVMPGIRLENHISKLQACFVGAFNLFDPLPIFLEQAIRRTYLEKGWYEDSRGGEYGLETPTLSDLVRNAEYIVSNSDFDEKMKSDFQASLLERLNSLRRGSKGRMLDTKYTIPADELMKKPVILELDSLNGDEKSLLMMFLLTYVFEYCKANRKSGSSLKHLLIVEEAHNLISSSGGSSEYRADPRGQTIELFINMLAEMRALGQGILIADQLPTAIAPQAVKQTNLKILMRITSKDDREEIGNTMGLNDEQMQRVVNFKTGFAYVYHEGEDRVRLIRMDNFKSVHSVEEPPSDEELKDMMISYEKNHQKLYMPYGECRKICNLCDRRVRNQAETFVQKELLDKGADPWSSIRIPELREKLTLNQVMMNSTMNEMNRISSRYRNIGECFGGCVFIHMIKRAVEKYPELLEDKAHRKLSKEEMNQLLDKFSKLRPLKEKSSE